MWNDQTQQRPHNHGAEDDGTDDDEQVIREIHALTPRPPPPPSHLRHPRPWETSSIRWSSSEGASSENFTTMSREFNALVVAGSVIANHGSNDMDGNNSLNRIGEEEEEELNPLAIVPDSNNPVGDPLPSPRPQTNSSLGGVVGVGSGGGASSSSSMMINIAGRGEMMMHQVKREEVETKISAWQTAKVAKVNNRFKREDAVISGWESEQVQKSTSWMKKVERKLEDKRAKALEKMQNEIAKANRKAEERRASAEAKRGTKVAKILEIANLMRALGRPPTKRSFF